MNEIQSVGAAVTPEDPQRRDLAVESAVSAALDVWHAACHTEASNLAAMRTVVAAVLETPGLLGHLLTSQGYEHETQVRPTLGVVSETRDAYVRPWSPIGGNE